MRPVYSAIVRFGPVDGSQPVPCSVVVTDEAVTFRLGRHGHNSACELRYEDTVGLADVVGTVSDASMVITCDRYRYKVYGSRKALTDLRRAIMSALTSTYGDD